MGKSKEFNRVPIVPGVPVVPNVQFRFMNKIDCEAPMSASPCASFNATEALPWGRKWPINGSSKFLGPESEE